VAFDRRATAEPGQCDSRKGASYSAVDILDECRSFSRFSLKCFDDHRKASTETATRLRPPFDDHRKASTATAKRLRPPAQGCRPRLPWETGANVTCNRNAVASSSPGLPSAATLGKARQKNSATTTGVRPAHSTARIDNARSQYT